MEIIENGTVPHDHYGPERHPDTGSVIPRSTRSDVEHSAFVQTFRELFSRDYNPFALLGRDLELQRSR